MDGWMYSIPSHGAMKVVTGKKNKYTVTCHYCCKCHSRTASSQQRLSIKLNVVSGQGRHSA